LRLDRRPGETLRTALERAIRDAIREGALRAGVRLPSSRRLADQLGVSRGVASDVYAQLEAQGFIEMSARSAPLVASVSTVPAHAAAQPKPTARRPPRFDMIATRPDVTLFPLGQWMGALKHATRKLPVSALDYGDPRGEASLRATLADHLGRTRGVVADPAQIIVVQGTAQGMDLLLRVLAARGAGRVGVEDPSMELQHTQIIAAGLETVGRPVDHDGIDLGALDADALILTPAHQFPTGAVLSGPRRRAVLTWAREQSGLVMEDDYDAEFRYDREPVRALQGLDPARVAYLGTVSKTLAPALRLGWIVVPEDLADEAANMKLLLDVFSPALDQLALQFLIESGDYDRHVRRVRAIYHERRDRLVAALTTHLPDYPVTGIAAGLHAVLQLPAGTDDQAIVREALADGIRVECLSRFARNDENDAAGLLIGYSRLHQASTNRAVAALAKVIARVGTAPRTPPNARSAKRATGEGVASAAASIRSRI
jgi:GntR family transcriptional regulator/MocR family aminotransferase